MDCPEHKAGRHKESCKDCIAGFNLIEALRTLVRSALQPVDRGPARSETQIEDLQEILHKLEQCEKNLRNYRAHVRHKIVPSVI
jgi:hypothetical protein